MSQEEEEEEESAVVTKLSSLLEQGPIHFEITILPGVSFSLSSSSDNDEESNSNAPQQERLALEESLSLVEGRYLGLDARSLPWMTQEIRQSYKRQKKRLLTTSISVTMHGTGTTESPAYHDSNADHLLRSWLQTIACLLLVNPDHATAWADRRRCLLHIIAFKQQQSKEDDKVEDGDEEEDPSSSCLLLWKKELEFVNLVMTQHSKAPFSWAHRKYVLQQIMITTTMEGTTRKDETKQTTTMTSLFKEEVRVCREVAERYPKNYYAWTHRRYFLGEIITESLPTTISVARKMELLEEEWEDIVTGWLNLHVSDHSAAHYASQILEMWTNMQLLQLQQSSSLIDGSSTTSTCTKNSSNYSLQQLATKVLSQVQALIERNESHETLWILRRMTVRILWNTRDSLVEELTRKEMRSVAAMYLANDDHDGSIAPSSVVEDNANALAFLAWLTCVVQQDDDMNARLTGKDDVPWMNGFVDVQQHGGPQALHSLLKDQTSEI